MLFVRLPIGTVRMQPREPRYLSDVWGLLPRHEVYEPGVRTRVPSARGSLRGRLRLLQRAMRRRCLCRACRVRNSRSGVLGCRHLLREPRLPGRTGDSRTYTYRLPIVLVPARAGPGLPGATCVPRVGGFVSRGSSAPAAEFTSGRAHPRDSDPGGGTVDFQFGEPAIVLQAGGSSSDGGTGWRARWQLPAQGMGNCDCGNSGGRECDVFWLQRSVSPAPRWRLRSM
jgi:hypothetical protein